MNAIKTPTDETEETPALLTRRDVAVALRVCGKTIERLTKEGLLPAVYFSRRCVRYRPRDVRQLVLRNCTPTAPR
jgi:hypothetical protein